MNADRTIAKHTARVTAANVLGTIISLVFSVLFAKLFGTTADADSYALAMIIPNVAYGLSNALFFTPVIFYAGKLLAEKKQKEATQFLASSIALSAGLFFGVGVLLFIISRILFAMTSPIPSSLLFVVSMTVPVLAILSVLNATLHTHNHFFIGHSMRIFSMLGATIGILLFPNIHSAAIGYLAGCLAAVALEAIVAIQHHYVTRSSSYGQSLAHVLKNLFQFGTPLLIGSLVYYLWRSLPLVLAIHISEGSAALWSYMAAVFFALPPLLTEPAGTVLYPQLARDKSSGSIHSVWRAMILSVSILIPLSIVLYTFAPHIVTFLFQRGAFSASDSAAGAQILSLLSISLPALGVQGLLLAVFTAYGRPWLHAGTLVLNLLFVALFTQLFQPITTTTLALSVASSLWIATAFSLLAVRNLLSINPHLKTSDASPS